MQATVLPNVMQDALASIQNFVSQVDVDPDFMKNYLQKLPMSELKNLHTVSMNKNIHWKTGTLAKVIYKAEYAKSNLVQSRMKVCEDAYKSSVAVLYAHSYFENGNYAQTAFTDDVLVAIEKRGEAKGKIEGRAEAVAAADDVYM